MVKQEKANKANKQNKAHKPKKVSKPDKLAKHEPLSPPEPVAAPLPPRPLRLGPDSYLNREIAWLEFNQRVLQEAADERNPLLERVNFLAIFTSNLDEFVMKRVGILERQVEADIPSRRPDRMTPRQMLMAIRSKVKGLLARQAKIFTKAILPALDKAGIQLPGYANLKEDDKKKADTLFRERIFPVLTPLAVDPGHPFPFLSNLSTSLGVTLKHPQTGERLFSRVKVPRVLPEYFSLEGKRPNGGQVFIGLTDLIANNLGELFPGMKVLNVMPFRITRNADVERDEDEAEDLLDLMEEEIRKRKFERVVRLEHGPDPDPAMIGFLLQELEIEEENVYEIPGLLDYTGLRRIAASARPDLRFESWIPQTPRPLDDEELDFFGAIRKRDVLIHHPYESFHTSIERFIRMAAEDPQVLAIKITLYRTGKESPFIPALIRAAEAGKQVVALVELKARFDEEANIQLAQSLEKVGVHVVYGIVGLKTHTKTALVVRQEPEGLRCYAHIGTGNYHSQTAKLYTDFSLLTCDSELTRDLVDLFHYLTGRSLKREYRKMLVAPFNMRDRFLSMIEREITHRKAGKPARIVAKMNALEDVTIIAALYQASKAGVPVDLVVRGVCCLRPGVPGLSENIRVISVIGRFLEHSRIFHFAAGEEDPVKGDYFIGSADWMARNLQGRVEVVTPIEDLVARGRLWETLQILMGDQRQAWTMQPDGSYVQRQPKPDAPLRLALGTHQVLMGLARQATGAAALDLPPHHHRGKHKKKKQK